MAIQTISRGAGKACQWSIAIKPVWKKSRDYSVAHAKLGNAFSHRFNHARPVCQQDATRFDGKTPDYHVQVMAIQRATHNTNGNLSRARF
jgi:hypothetical protein